MKSKLLFSVFCMVMLVCTVAGALALEQVPKYGIIDQNSNWLSGTKGTGAYINNWSDIGVSDTMPLVSDLDGSGVNEVIESRASVIKIFEPDGTLLTSKVVSGLGNRQLAVYNSTHCSSGKALYVLTSTNALEMCFDGSVLTTYQTVSTGGTVHINDTIGMGMLTYSGEDVFGAYNAEVNGSNIVAIIDFTTGSYSQVSVDGVSQSTGVPAVGNPYNDGKLYWMFQSKNNTFNGVGVTFVDILGGQNQIQVAAGAGYPLARMNPPIFVQRGGGNPDDVLMSYNTVEVGINSNEPALNFVYMDATGYVYSTSFGTAHDYASTPSLNYCGYSVSSPSQLGAGGDICYVFGWYAGTAFLSFESGSQLICINPTTLVKTYNSSVNSSNFDASLPLSPTRLTAMDMNDDGYADFFISRQFQDGNGLRCLYTSPSAPLTCTEIGNKDNWMYGIDINNDGYRDIVESDFSDNLLKISLTNSSITPPTTTCSDTDSGSYPTLNYYVQGTMTATSISLRTDYCSGNIVNEFYCNTSSAYHSLTPTAYDCAGEGKLCSNGACVNPPTNISSRFYRDDFNSPTLNVSMWDGQYVNISYNTTYEILSSRLKITGTTGSFLFFSNIDNSKTGDVGYVKTQYSLQAINVNGSDDYFVMGVRNGNDSCGARYQCVEDGIPTNYNCGLWAHGAWVSPTFSSGGGLHTAQVSFRRESTYNLYTLYYDGVGIGGSYQENTSQCPVIGAPMEIEFGRLNIASSGGFDANFYYMEYSITSQNVAVSCTDTDSGVNFDMLGQVTYVNTNGTIIYNDQCTGAWQLKEYSCDAFNRAIVTYKPCGCQSGVCVNYGTCNDTDYAGSYPTIQPFTFGTVTVSSGQTFSDYCVGNNDYVLEYYCNDPANMNSAGSQQIHCQPGYTCTGGACVAQSNCTFNPPTFDYPVRWYETFDYGDAITAHGWTGYPFQPGSESYRWYECNRLFFDRSKSSDEIYYATSAISENFSFQFSLKPMSFSTDVEYDPYQSPVYVYLKDATGAEALTLHYADNGYIEYVDGDGATRQITRWGDWSEAMGYDYLIVMFPAEHKFNFYYTELTSSLEYTLGCANCTYNSSTGEIARFGFKPDFTEVTYGFFLDTLKVTLGDTTATGQRSECPANDANCLFYDTFSYSDQTSNHGWYSYAATPTNGYVTLPFDLTVNFDHSITPYTWGTGDGIVTYQFNAQFNKPTPSDAEIAIYAKDSTGTQVLLTSWSDMVYEPFGLPTYRSISPYPWGSWNTYSFVINTNKNTYSFYIDGLVKVSNHPLLFTSNDIGIVGFQVNTAGRQVLINSVRVEKGQAFANGASGQDTSDTGVNPNDLRNCWSGNGTFDWTCCDVDEQVSHSGWCPVRVTGLNWLGNLTLFALNNIIYVIIIAVLLVIFIPFFVPRKSGG